MVAIARAGLLILKWLIIPAGLAAVGYYVIGPRLGNLPIPNMSSAPSSEPQHEEGAVSDKGKQAVYPSPDVNVKVGAVAHGDAEARAQRRRHKKATTPKAKPAEHTPGEATPPPDQGGSGGAATGGGTTGGTDGQ